MYCPSSLRAECWVLEVDGVAPSGEVGAGQVGGTTEKLGNRVGDLAEDGSESFREGNSVVGRLVGGEGLLSSPGGSLPAIRRATSACSLGYLSP